MAEFFNLQAVLLPVAADGTVVSPGTLNNGGTAFIGAVPTDAMGGGVTIGTAFLWNNAAVAAVGSIVMITLATTGALSGTIGSTVGAVVANTPKAFTITDAWVDGGEMIAVRLGTATAASIGDCRVIVTGKIGR